MNIFLTSPDPSLCALALDDKRLPKMVLETAQLLSTACNVLLPDHGDGEVYKTTHLNHPCAVFPRLSRQNFLWLVDHGLCLAGEYHHRFDRRHKSEAVIRQAYRLLKDNHPYSSEPFSFSFNCSGFDTGDVFEDYKHCMRWKWESDNPKPTWRYRKVPTWLKN